MQPDILASAPRCGARTRGGTPCRSPAVHGRARCRMHGGARGSGAPRGNRNAFRHGARSGRMAEIARYLRMTSLRLRLAGQVLRTGTLRLPSLPLASFPRKRESTEPGRSWLDVPPSMESRFRGNDEQERRLSTFGPASQDERVMRIGTGHPASETHRFGRSTPCTRKSGTAPAKEILPRRQPGLAPYGEKPQGRGDFAGLSSSHLPRRRRRLICPHIGPEPAGGCERVPERRRGMSPASAAMGR
jgi:glucans biosynthesis protein